MNLLMRGVKFVNMILCNVDMFKIDWFYGEVNGEDNLLFVDCVVVNLFYFVKWNSECVDKDICFKDYGIVFVIKVDYVFLFYLFYYLK